MSTVLSQASLSGFESLEWSPEPVEICERGYSPRLGRTDEDEVVVVYSARVPQEVILSRRIRNAFSPWPRVDEPVEHQRHPGLGIDGEVTAWHNGTFAVKTNLGGFVAGVGEPGTRLQFNGPIITEPALSGGLYVWRGGEGGARLAHRASRSVDTHVRRCGTIPSNISGFGTATNAGGLLLAAFERTDKGIVATLHRLVDGVLVAGSAFPIALDKPEAWAVPKPGGGAYFAVESDKTVFVFTVDESGTFVGEPLRYLQPSGDAFRMAFSTFRNGFALAASHCGGKGGLGIVVSDGESATYSAGELTAATIPLLKPGGLVASSDGTVLLLAHQKGLSLQLRRLVCGAGEATRRVPAFGSRAKPRAPAAKKPHRFGTRDEIVRRLRERSLAAELVQLRGIDAGADPRSHGTLSRGEFLFGGGRRDFFVAVWAEEGLVALGFEHDHAFDESRLPAAERDPTRCFKGLPEVLRPLAQRAALLTEQLGTEAFWVTAEPPQEHGSVALHRLAARVGLPYVVGGHPLYELKESEGLPYWVPGGFALHALITQIAGTDSYVITSEDEAIVLTWAGKNPSPYESPVAVRAEVVPHVAQRLATFGVQWDPSPEAVRAAAQVAPSLSWFDEVTDEWLRKAAAPSLSEAELALYVGACVGDLDAVKRALDLGACIDRPLSRDELPPHDEGSTALVLSLLHDHPDVSLYLIAAGAEIHLSIYFRLRSRTPLFFAVAGARLTLVRLLLSRGAEQSYGAGLVVMDAVPLCPKAPRTIADSLEVVRTLLDAGGPLPTAAQCVALALMAEAAGSTDLVPRLEPTYDEAPPLETAHPIDPAANAQRVSELLERAASVIAKDTAAALTYLIDAWRASLHPRIGDAAETLAERVRGEALDYIVRVDQKLDGDRTRERVQAARTAPLDPRAARSLLRWLWSDVTSDSPVAVAQCESAAAALLLQLRDVRFTESLEAWCTQRSPRAPRAFRESIPAALQATKEVVPLPLTEADLRNLAVIEEDNSIS